jgi:hypothetical protein
MSLARDLADGVINGLTPQASNMQPFNRIINGAMTIDQRNAGAAVTPLTNTYVIDRWAVTMGQASKFTTQISSTAPTGFSNSLLCTTTTAATGSYFYTYQRIEGYNWADLGWGTANAKTVTLSFWVRSSVTGSHDGFIRDSTQAVDSTFSYSISSANTWEYKSATIAGATTGTYPATNGIGAALFINIANEVAVSGATFYITGVQLEAGSSASSFAHEFVGDTLSKCYRYYYYAGVSQGAGYQDGATNIQATFTTPVPMRATPALTTSGTTYIWRHNGYASQFSPSNTISNYSGCSLMFNITGYSGGVNGYVANWYSAITCSAEL